MTQKIKEEAFEYVSIAMDNEDLSDEMLDKLLADDEASQKWYEYHLISDYMQQAKQGVGRDADFMQSEMFTSALAEISREHQARHAAQEAQTQIRPAANQAFKGFAVAASVAALAVSVWQFWPQANESAHMPVAVEKAQPQTVDQNIVPVRAAAETKAASDVVVPNAAKQLSSQQNNTAVHVESQTGTNTPPKEIVQ